MGEVRQTVTERVLVGLHGQAGAVAAALTGTAFYLLLSGSTIPTQRAFLM